MKKLMVIAAVLLLAACSRSDSGSSSGSGNPSGPVQPKPNPHRGDVERYSIDIVTDVHAQLLKEGTESGLSQEEWRIIEPRKLYGILESRGLVNESDLGDPVLSRLFVRLNQLLTEESGQVRENINAAQIVNQLYRGN